MAYDAGKKPYTVICWGKNFWLQRFGGTYSYRKPNHPCPLPLPLKSEIVDPNDGLFLLMGLGTRLEGSMNKIWNHILIRPTANVTLNLTFCKVGNEQMKVVQRKYVQKVALNVYLWLHIIYSNRKVTGETWSRGTSLCYLQARFYKISMNTAADQVSDFIIVRTQTFTVQNRSHSRTIKLSYCRVFLLSC